MTKAHALFIVGAPRSGTKLLRSLLNNHPEISLGGEGRYIPALVKRYGVEADLSQAGLQREIYREFSNTASYEMPTGQGVGLSEAAFISTLASYEAKGSSVTWASIFEVLMRVSGPHPEARIYGDKSHGYISAVPLLRNLLDGVRFIYIVRDPRDQALSVLKTWGRNPLRSAHHWLSVAHSAHQFGFDTAPDVITVRYEDLTDDTEKEMERICAFLQVAYEPGMATLKSPAERERKGQQFKNVTKQHAKYRDALSTDMVKSISEIVLPYLAKYGYPEEGVVRQRTFTPAKLGLLRLIDGFTSLRFHMRDKGWSKGAGHYLKRHFHGFATLQFHMGKIGWLKGSSYDLKRTRHLTAPKRRHVDLSVRVEEKSARYRRSKAQSAIGSRLHQSDARKGTTARHRDGG